MSRARSVRAERRNNRSDLGARVLVAIPAVAFALFIVIMGGWWFTAGAIGLGVIALGELFGMYARAKPIRLAGFVGVIGLSVAAHLGGERQVLLATMALFPVLFLIAMGQRGPGERPVLTARMAVTLLGATWIGLALAHAILLRDLPHGGGIMIDILVGTFIGDTGAYLGGRALGRRPLALSISPNKTVEGLFIGMAIAVIATWCAGLYQDWLGHGQALLLGLAVATMAPLGDLFESQVKRDAQTKDAGSLFGAHGGALDRLDAAFFSLVAGYYVWLAML
jgi:phosphatidate cytidylyltransferase